MPDNLTRRLRYFAGNCIRLITSPWREQAIPPELATTIFGCNFGDKGWHHVKVTLGEYDRNTAIAPEKTTLWRYLKKFCPSSISTLAGVTNENPLPIFNYPWGTFNVGQSTKYKSPLASRFCGPSTDDFIREEFFRTIALYKTVSVTGYRPYQYPNSFIGGSWLIADNGEKRFVVMQGNHRMAILSHLGYSTIRVRTIKQAIPCISEKDLSKWPLVASKRCSPAHARTIFRFFWGESGWHVAKEIDKSTVISDS